MNSGIPPTRAPGGFTLVELLVVIGVIVVISTFLLPAFTRIIESSNLASAINSVTVTLGNARARAIGTGRPAGVVFLFDAKEERYSLLVVEAAGSEGGTLTIRPMDPTVDISARGFIPASLSVAVQLPLRTGVFGLSGQVAVGQDVVSKKIDNETWQWYAGEAVNGDNASATDDIPLWLFPRNDPRLFTEAAAGETIGQDPWDKLVKPPNPAPTISTDEAIEAIRNASSFMVLFGADGTMQEVDRFGGREYRNFYLEFPDEPFEDDPSSANAGERKPYDSNTRFDPENFGRPIIPDKDRRRNPEVMLRSVSQVAIVDLKRLDEGVGLPRAWLTRAADSKTPKFDWLTIESVNRAGDYVDDERARAVSRWIDRNAEIVGFNRYTGNVIRRRLQ